MRRIDWGFIGVMVFFAVLMCLIALGIVGFVENERNSIQCGIVVDKGYTAAYSSYRYDADTGRSSSTSHGPQYRICIEGEKTVQSFNIGSAQRRKNMQEAASASFLRDEGSERK